MSRPVRFAVAYDCLYPYTTGGGERQYRGFAEALYARGMHVTYLTSRQWDAPPHETNFSVVPVTGPLRLYDRDGVRRIPAALRYAFGLFRHLKKHRRDYDCVIVSALPVLNVLATRLALIGTGVPVVVDWLEVWGLRQWVTYAGRVTGLLAWSLQRVAIALSPIATCHSQLSGRRLRAEGLRSAPVISPGLIADSAPPSRDDGTAVPPFILYAGRHIPDKRVTAIPKAAAYARRHVPELRAIILGTGPSTASIRGAVDEADGQEWISMPGFVDEDELLELMSSAACLVNPSQREGYGLVVVEAARFGTPVVLVEDEGNAATELVEEGVNGYVAASTDAESLGEAITRAITDGASLRRRTRAWYDDARRTRTISRTIDGILSALDHSQHREPRRTPR